MPNQSEHTPPETLERPAAGPPVAVEVPPKQTQAHTLALQYEGNLPGADALAIEIVLALTNTNAVRDEAFERFLEPLGGPRSRSRFTILRTLYFAEGKRRLQNQIGKQMRSTSGNVTYHVDLLEKEGLVRRVINEADRRETYVELTDAGDRLAARVVPEAAKYFATLCAGFTDDDKRLFIEFLDRFYANIDANFWEEIGRVR